MYISTDTVNNALPSYFNYYCRKLKVGLTMGIESGSFLKFGMAKSYTAAKIGEVMDRTFTIQKIILEPSEFSDAMNDMERRRRPAQVLSIDEAGILVNLRKWQSFVNKAISDVVITFRDLNSICIFVSPDILILDKQVRIFISHLMRTKKELTTSNKIRVTGKFYRLNWLKQGSFYHTNFINMYAKDIDRKIRISSFDVKMLDKGLAKDYEDKIAPYKSKIRRSIIKIKKDKKNIPFFVDRFFTNLELDVRTKDYRTTKALVYHKKNGQPFVISDEIREFFDDLPVRKAGSISRQINKRLEESWIKSSTKRK